jgi:hypothetical protein
LGSAGLSIGSAKPEEAKLAPMRFLDNLRDLRLRWRAASLHGAALRAESSGQDVNAHDLAEEAIAVLDQCKQQDSPDALAVRLTATVLFDRVASKLGKPADRGKLERAAALAKPFAGMPQFDEVLAWLSHRLQESKPKSR